MTKAMKENGTETPDAKRSLLMAAAELFAQQGFSATGVQQITDAAGVNKAMLYYYFVSKNGLYDVLITEGIRAVEGAVSAVEDVELPLRERIRLFIERYISVVVDHPNLARILFREIMGSGERARQTVLDHFTDIFRRMALVFDQAQAQGALRAMDSALLAYSLFGMATMFISSHFVTGRPLDVQALAAHIADLFLNGAGLIVAEQ